MSKSESKFESKFDEMIKLGRVVPHLKKIQKYIIHMTHFMSFADTAFLPENSNFCLSRIQV